MCNLFRADLFRMVRMRSFWVCVAVSVALMLTVAGCLNWVASPEFAHMVNDSISEESLQGVSEADRAEMQADVDEALQEVEPLNDKVMESLTDTWASTFMDGGFLALIGSLFAGIFLIMDFKGGFIKNLPFDRRGRIRYYAEKLIFVAFIQLIFLVICAVFSTLFFGIFGFSYEIQDSASGIVLWLLLVWLVCTAYAFIVACVTWAIRSEALSTVVVVVVSSGVVGAFAKQLMYYLGTMLPVFAYVPQWMLVSTFSDLRAGAPALMDAGTEGVASMMSLAGHAALVACICIAVGAVVALVFCRKKDLR